MLKLAEIFQDGMILQRGQKIRIWGQSDEKRSLEVFLNGENLGTFLVNKGSFSFFLPSQDAKENAVLRIGEVTLKNVDFGDVFLAGGQSNMEFILKYDASYCSGEIPGEDEHLRNFTVGQYEFEGEKEEGLVKGEIWDRWISLKKENCSYISAVGLYFAMKLRSDLKIPIGILACNFGGSKASSWVKKEDLKGDLEIYIQEYEDGLKKIDIPQYLAIKKNMREGSNDPGNAKIMDGIMYGGEKLAEAFKVIGEQFAKFGKDPQEFQKMMAFNSQIGPIDKNRPEGLFDVMLSPVIGFNLKGVLFYQGESDDYHGDLYQQLFTALINRWRKEWGQELPFFFVQLAPFGTWMMSDGKKFPLVRKAQEEVFKTVKDVYMVSSSDVGDLKDIHPKLKKPLGERLALAAEHNLYHLPVSWLAPQGISFSKEGKILTIAFANGEGLYLKGEILNGLELMIGGEVVQPVKTEIKEDKLLLTLKEENEGEVKISFAQTDYYQVNLYNKAGLPCFPFVLK